MTWLEFWAVIGVLLACVFFGSPEKRVGTEQMNNIQKTDNRVELGK